MSDFCFSDMEPFRRNYDDHSDWHVGTEASARGRSSASSASQQRLYDGPAWIGNTTRHVLVWKAAHGIDVEIAKIGRFSVDRAGSHVQIQEISPGVSHDLLTEGVLGLPFIYAMALHNTWTLHGSAAQYRNRLAIFLGESGYGKSTLARFLGTQRDWLRVSDDILQARADGDRVYALPHFPQLKLPPGEQPPLHVPEQLPIGAIYSIAAPESSTVATEIRQLSPVDAISAVIGQGVSARAFERPLLARHFEFCHLLAASAPVRQLSYPRTKESLPILQELLERDLADLQPSGN